MKDTCTVTNKSASRTGYAIKEKGIRREFMPYETRKNVSIEELEALAQQPGGKNILLNYLQVHDAEVINYLLNAEPPLEYWLVEDKIPSWMTSCTLAEFQDALDFAPEGTKDIIKRLAVSLPLNDMSKREAIKTQLGYDVSKAIEMAHAFDKTEDTKTADSATKQAERRAQPTGRRTTVSSITPPEKETKKKED